MQVLLGWLRGSAEAVGALLAPTATLPSLLLALEDAHDDAHLAGHLVGVLSSALVHAPGAALERPLMTQMITNRLGLEVYQALWDAMRRHPAYTATVDGRGEWWTSDEETEVLVRRAAATHHALLYADGFAVLLQRTCHGRRHRAPLRTAAASTPRRRCPH